MQYQAFIADIKRFSFPQRQRVAPQQAAGGEEQIALADDGSFYDLHAPLKLCTINGDFTIQEYGIFELHGISVAIFHGPLHIRHKTVVGFVQASAFFVNCKIHAGIRDLAYFAHKFGD